MSVVEAMMKIRKMIKIYKIVSSGFFSCIRCLLDVTVKKFDTTLSMAGATLKRAFPGASVVKNLPSMEEMQVNLWVRKMPWRRKWQPIRKSHAQRSLVGYSPWGHKESDTTQ